MIAVIDYGMGNLRSVQRALEAVGADVLVTQDPASAERADKLVVPGQGAFNDARIALADMGLLDVISRHIRQGRPYLGICLGLQLLMETSFEDGRWAGLAYLEGTVERFAATHGALKVPQIGWNAVEYVRDDCPLFAGIPDKAHFYFAHSYVVKPSCRDVVAGCTRHGECFASVIWRDAVMATQFHPEKSQKRGLQLLKNFVALD